MYIPEESTPKCGPCRTDCFSTQAEMINGTDAEVDC